MWWAISVDESAVAPGHDLISVDMFTQNQIEWRDIPGYEGLYQVSNDGRVFSMPRLRTRKDGTVYHIPGREKRPSAARYPYVSLWKDGSMQYGRIHQLVMLA